jgi:hypothetical protein
MTKFKLFGRELSIFCGESLGVIQFGGKTYVGIAAIVDHLCTVDPVIDRDLARVPGGTE